MKPGEELGGLGHCWGGRCGRHWKMGLWLWDWLCCCWCRRSSALRSAAVVGWKDGGGVWRMALVERAERSCKYKVSGREANTLTHTRTLKQTQVIHTHTHSHGAKTCLLQFNLTIGAHKSQTNRTELSAHTHVLHTHIHTHIHRTPNTHNSPKVD